MHELITNRGVFTGEKIGKGAFTTAYREYGEPHGGYVLLVTDDPMKDVLHDLTGTANPHLPGLDYVGYLVKTGESVYRTNYFPRLRAASVAAWAQYKVLRALADDMRWYGVARKSGLFPVHEFDHRVRHTEGLPESLKDAISLLCDSALEYQAPNFEFAPRNLGTSGDTLILLDVLYDQYALDERSNRKRA